MAAVVPRWEWRAIAAHFGPAEARLAELAPTGVQESDELYILGGAAVSVVKVRNALMDVKLLRQVDANGLERWEPVMKQAFPLSVADAASVCASLGVAAPGAEPDAWSLAEFLAEVVTPGSGLHAVQVHKRRVRYLVGGCAAELTEVLADGKPGRTLAIEAEDPAAVVSAVAGLRLGGFTNTNYPRGLQMLLDDAPERYAVIDVGTNSVKLHVAERSHGPWRAVADRAELTRLGEGLEASGAIAPEAAERTASAIRDMAGEARGLGARAIVAVGTAGLRAAANSAAILEDIRARTGISVEVISGEEESRLAYRAVELGLGMSAGALVVFDTGGGSTQLTFGRDGQVEERFSVPVGAAGYTERFGLAHAVTPDVLHQALEAISAGLSRVDGHARPDAVVGMGGAVTNLAAVKLGLAVYDPDVIQGAVLDVVEIDRQIEMYRSRDTAARRLIVGLQPKRAEVILAGACIVRTVMGKLGAASLTVSDRGLRHGVVVERFGP